MQAAIIVLSLEQSIPEKALVVPYQSNIEAFPDYIRAEVSGVRVPGEAVADANLVGQEIVRLCRETGLDKVLLVLNLSGRLPVTDAYDIVANSEQYGWSRQMKLAFVDLNKDSLEDSQFIETVAVNRAFPMTVFDNEEDARDWLLG
jgi:hypothetical protein